MSQHTIVFYMPILVTGLFIVDSFNFIVGILCIIQGLTGPFTVSETCNIKYFMF